MPSYVKLPSFTGEIVAWGDDSNGQVSDPHPGDDFVKVVAGGSRQSLAIRKDGTLLLWGGQPPLPNGNPVPQPSNLSGVPVVDAALGLEHLIAIRADYGTISHSGTFIQPSSWVPPPTARRAIAVTAAAAHDVAIDIYGELFQWGHQAATGTPVPGGAFKKVRARGNYTIALRDDGCVLGWGGVFADPAGLDMDLWENWAKDRTRVWCVHGPFADIAAGVVQKDYKKRPELPAQPMPHVLAIYAGAGRVEGWGANNNRETETPQGRFQAVAAGLGYSLGLDEDGFLHQWGSSLLTYARTHTTTVSGQRPQTPRGKFMSISASASHAAAVRQPVLLVGADFRESTLRQPTLERAVTRSDELRKSSGD